MSEIIQITLPQLVLWYDSTRIQTWPSILAKADPNLVYRSTRDFGKQCCTDRITKSGHSAADNLTKSLPGLEFKKNRTTLRGIGLLERVHRGYQVSDVGRNLADEYKQDSKSIRWVKALGELLLLREPRTRVFVRLLSGIGSMLYFTEELWWGGSIARATINYPDGQQLLPFSEDNAHGPNLRSKINESSWWALGQWRNIPQLQQYSDCKFIGQSREEFSLFGVQSAIRAAFVVFLFLGVVCYQADRCWLDQTKATQVFGSRIADDFGWTPEARGIPLQKVISNFINENQLDSGFVVASELRSLLLQRGFENPDREIAKLEAEGQLSIEAADYGQSRHGIGLYDDPSKQLIKLRVF
jgi:hypothetical protein